MKNHMYDGILDSVRLAEIVGDLLKFFERKAYQAVQCQQFLHVQKKARFDLETLHIMCV